MNKNTHSVGFVESWLSVRCSCVYVYGAIESAYTENLSANLQGWKMQVQNCRGGNRLYGNGKRDLGGEFLQLFSTTA